MFINNDDIRYIYQEVRAIHKTKAQMYEVITMFHAPDFRYMELYEAIMQKYNDN